MKVIYKITFPNGKIYIGKDSTNTLTYFGSMDSKLVEADFDDVDKDDFIIRKQILEKYPEETSESEIIKRENELIKANNSNDPAIGYNRNIRYRK